MGLRANSLANNKASSQKPMGRFLTKSGFTILELLIVLALLLALLAIAWPQINKRIQRSELKQIALTLQEQISDARTAAIENGEIWKLRFDDFSNGYELGPLSAFTEEKMVRDTILVGADQRGDDSDENVVRSMRTDLDPFCFLTTIEKEKLVFDDNADRQILETIQIGADEGASPGLNSSKEIMFFPDGRATEMKLTIIDQRSRTAIELKIRGLTGQVEIGGFLRIDAVIEVSGDDDESLPDEDDESLDLALEV